MFSRTFIAISAVAVCALATGDGTPTASAGAAGARAAELDRADRLRCAKKPTPRKRRACRRRAAARQQPVPFAPNSFWNAPLAANAPLDARSSAYVTRLQELLKRWSPYVNTTRYSAPVYTVPADQPTVHVTLDKENSPDLQAAFDRVPIPERARPAAGDDAHMVVWQPSSDTMWEFWVARRLNDGWHAHYGGRIANVSAHPGHYTAITTESGRYTEHPRWGATATSLPLLGGLMRLEELNAGRIDHALAIALPEIRANAYSWPAQRTDGQSYHLNAIPAGAHFRIDPALDLSTIEMSPMVRAMAVAAQRYGIVVRDSAGAVTFFGEDPTPTGRNPFVGAGGLLGGGYISEQLREFPWDHLQVLQTRMSYEN
jgi:hypothetical protein